MSSRLSHPAGSQKSSPYGLSRVTNAWHFPIPASRSASRHLATNRVPSPLLRCVRATARYIEVAAAPVVSAEAGSHQPARLEGDEAAPGIPAKKCAEVLGSVRRAQAHVLDFPPQVPRGVDMRRLEGADCRPQQSVGLGWVMLSHRLVPDPAEEAVSGGRPSGIGHRDESRAGHSSVGGAEIVRRGPRCANEAAAA